MGLEDRSTEIAPSGLEGWARGGGRGRADQHGAGGPAVTGSPPRSEAALLPSPSQMFNCITELVLRAKKDNLAKQQQQQQNDVVKLTKNSKRKKRCC